MAVIARMNDANLALKAAGAITSTTSGSFVDLGAAARLDATIVIEVTSIDSTTGDEFYIIALEGSSDGSTVAARCGYWLWDASAAVSLPTAGSRLEIPITNAPYGTAYRYLRLTSTLAGTTPSVNFSARLTKGALS